MFGDQRTIVANADRVRPPVGDLRDERAHPFTQQHERPDAGEFLAAHSPKVHRVSNHAFAEEIS